jgi:hypothetical protein
MITDNLERPETPRPGHRRSLWARISRLELVLAALAGVVMVALIGAEPDILEAPFENWRTLLFTFGGTALAAVALVFMVALGVPPVIRVIVLGVPFVVVSWWLISPFFIDEEIEDRFETSIAAAQAAPPAANNEATTTIVPSTLTASQAPTAAPTTARSDSTALPPTAPAGPVLLGAGRFAGLAGHDGTGDAGIFRAESSHVLRLENLDIDNGPDLRLYLLPGADQVSPDDTSLYLGPLRGNVGNLTYELPAEFQPTAGPWTVLVWCEAFDVEFVGATLTIN